MPKQKVLVKNAGNLDKLTFTGALNFVGEDQQHGVRHQARFADKHAFFDVLIRFIDERDAATVKLGEYFTDHGF